MCVWLLDLSLNDDFLQRWLVLLKPLSASDKDKQEVYNTLRSHYAESHRAYHTFEHIKACLHHLDNVVTNVDNAFYLELALWFHDVIYDPKSTTNERDSALYASDILQALGLSQQASTQVNHLILLTQHPSNPQTFDEQILIDIDLSILGAESSGFAIYEKNIRQEYCWVDEKTYRSERAKVLASFLVQPRIYQTDYFFTASEQRARKNIDQLLETLSQHTDP